MPIPPFAETILRFKWKRSVFLRREAVGILSRTAVAGIVAFFPPSGTKTSCGAGLCVILAVGKVIMAKDSANQQKSADRAASLLREIDPSRVPRHVAIIMDGNGRWANGRGLPRIEGHRAGIEAVRRAVEAARDLNIEYLTLYAFSMENWKRPKTEIRALFQLLRRYLKEEQNRILKENIRFRAIGRLSDLPPDVQRLLRQLIEQSEGNTGRNLTLALSYGGRTEIADACSRLLSEALASGRTGSFTPEEIASHMYAPELPDPDLLIRTSGEFRVSNFLLWQIAYTEVAILDIFWPEFGKEDFYEAVLDYQQRDRRYGGVQGQLPGRKKTHGGMVS